MAAAIDVETARRILGDDLLGPVEVRDVFGLEEAVPPIPYSPAEIESAASAGGELLVLRTQRAAGKPLTLLRLIERAPNAFDRHFLRKMGYQLKEEWGIELEPLANSETSAPGWMLVRKEILDETRNLPYEEQTEQMRGYARSRRVHAGAIRRRSAVETAYDLVLYQAARGVRLLADTWDWTTSRTLDGGYLNVGGFGPNGMQVLSYSTAVRHGALGVCPSRSPQAAG